MNALWPPIGTPKAWPRERLGNLADSRLGKMLDKAKNTGTPRPYLRNPNIRWFEVDLTDLQTIPVEDNDVAKYELIPGDVLICEGGEAGRAAIWGGEAEGVIFQKACHRVRVGPQLDARFLVHRLMYDYFSGGLDDYYTGATIKHFTGQDLARYEFPLPPVDEQRRIAAILDKADALRRKRKRALDLLDGLTQSIFLEMFGDPIANSAGLPVAPLHEVVSAERKITYGILKPGPDLAGGVPYVRVIDIQNSAIDVSGLKRTSKAIAHEYKRSSLKQGDLLISIRGHVGRMAIAPSGCEGANITQDTARLAIESAETEFIKAQLETDAAQNWMARRTKGAAVKGINLGDLKMFPLLLPARDRQKEFCRRVSGIRRKARAAAEQLDGFELLFTSLQHRAFSGQL